MSDAYTHGNSLDTVKLIEAYRIPIHTPVDNEIAIVIARKIAKKIGFGVLDETMIATVASELATNIIRYAKKGEIIINIIEGDTLGIEILAKDDGPGIRNIEKALTNSYSTTERSLGMGLPSVRRIVDDFYIESKVNVGTRIHVRKWCTGNGDSRYWTGI